MITNLLNEETYDTTQLNCWSFCHGYDEREGITLAVGNMCSGFPFTIQGQRFNNSEAAFIAGMFSCNTELHLAIQTDLQLNTNGFAAKKSVRRKHESDKRADWAEFNVQWMLYVVWQKCLTNNNFRRLLTSIPADAVIIENSTKQRSATAAFWGAKNKELELARKEMDTTVEQRGTFRYKKDLQRAQMIEKNKINSVGSFKGVNCLGKILKLCQTALLTGSEPSIDYKLLNEKEIYLLGKRIDFSMSKQDS